MTTSVCRFDSSQQGSPVVNGAGTLITMLDAVLVDGFGLSTVDSITVAAGVATVNISAGHSAIEAGVMLIAGATVSALNGRQKVLSAATAKFTFDATGVADGNYTGTITAKVAPAGWEKVFSGTNKAVYRSLDPASTRTYLRVDDNSNATFAVPAGFLAMTDIDTGTGQFWPSVHWNRTNGTAGSRPWWVVANASMVYFGIKTHGTASTDGFAICAFGDLIPRRSGDPYCCILAGANNAAFNWGSANVDMSALIQQQNSGFGIAVSFTQLGAGVIAKPMAAYQTSVQSGNVATIPFPNGGDNSVVLAQAECSELSTACLRGKLPGLYFCPQRPNGALLNDFAIKNAADFPGKTLLWKLTGSAAAGNYGGCAIDVTGPWE